MYDSQRSGREEAKAGQRGRGGQVRRPARGERLWLGDNLRCLKHCAPARPSSHLAAPAGPAAPFPTFLGPTLRPPRTAVPSLVVSPWGRARGRGERGRAGRRRPQREEPRGEAGRGSRGMERARRARERSPAAPEP